MATTTQVALTTAGTGSLAAAGAYGITQAVNGGEGEETTSEEQESTDNTIPPALTFTKQDLTSYTNKFLSLTREEHLQFLVKPDNNEEWWKWAYENKYQTKKVNNQRHSLFNKVNDSETLKEACKNSYLKEKVDYKFEDGNYLLENISTFCTKGRDKKDISEPKAEVWNTDQRASGYENGVLSILENTKLLVKKEQGTNNDLWWKWAFKKLYKTPYSELTKESNKLLKNIKEFCSIDRSDTLLKLPEPKLENDSLLKSGDSSYTNSALVKENDSKLVDPSKEQDWWNWIFTNVYLISAENKTTLKDPFNGEITKGYEDVSSAGSTKNSLNTACKDAYSKDKNTLGAPKTDNSTLISQIKKFCSPSSVTGDLTQPT